MPARSLDEAIGSISDEYFNQFETLELKLAIDTLNDESQNLLHLTYIYGYKSHELADMFGLSDSNVRKKLQFAKHKLKLQLEVY